jgi:hypothetical protein
MLLADYLLDLPASVRETALVAWLGLGAEALAAVIEEKYPELGERLTSTVELAGDADTYHGSPALIALLMSDTETRTHRLDFLRAFPLRAAGRLAGLAVGALALVLSPALVWPGQYAELGRRFFLAWHVPGLAAADGGAPNAVAVEPIRLAKDSPTVAVTPPEYAQAVVKPQTFQGIVPVSALQHSQLTYDFRFSRPVQTATLVRSPSAASIPWLGLRGWPAIAALGQWSAHAAPQKFSLQVGEDRTAAQLPLVAQNSGLFADRLVLMDECGHATEIDLHLLTVRQDQPPTFREVKWKDDPQTAQPYDKLPVKVALTDDIGLRKVELEYRVNGARPQTETVIEFKEAAPRQAATEYVFELKDKLLKDGDEVRYRLKASDNRPPALGGPNVAHHPADAWRALRIARPQPGTIARAGADEKDRQREIDAQHKGIDRKLEDIERNLKSELRALNKLRAQARSQADLPPAQAENLKQLGRDNRGVETALRDLARETEEDAELRPISQAARAIADQRVYPGGEALNQAAKQTTPQPRDEQFQKADVELTKALEDVQKLRAENRQLAQERRDHKGLEQIAEKERNLAERTADQARRDPIKDPASPAEADRLRQEQADLANRLQQQVQQSERLRQALERAQLEEARQLAQRARDLADDQRELAQASKQRDQREQEARLADLARRQQELAEKAARLAEETRQPAQAARTNPLKPEDAQKAAEALKQGDAGEAMQRQDRAARELDRLAADLDRSIDLAKDPREAARQLARLEEGLRQRLAEETRKRDAKEPLAQRLQPLQREQEALQRAVAALPVPQQNQAAQKEAQEAARQTAQAAEALKNQDPRHADAQMTQARQALDRLADRLPALAQRQQQAAAEVARLRQQQEQIAHLAEQAARQAEKQDPAAAKTREDLAQRLADATRRQAEVAERLSRLDVPKEEARQERTQAALNRALADLMDARPQDIPASQQEARRELERLHQALTGKTPADEQARELARRQRQLADEAARLAADPKATPQQAQEVQRRQQQVAQETRALATPEAPQRHAEAAEATRRAEQAAQAQPTTPETQRRMEEAAKALERLAQQVSGQEPEAARAERLARQQAEMAAQAERLAKAQPAQPATAEEQRRQQHVAEEARQLRGGKDAQAEKQRALQALARAEKAATPAERAQAQRQAADALRDLADRKAGRTDDAARAAEFARQQRELAQEAARDPKPGDPSPAEAARQAADRQADLARQLERQTTPAAAQARKQAAEQMAAARRALEQAQKPADAREELRRATQAAEDLARELTREHDPARQPGRPTEHTAAKPADQTPRQAAEQMARQQRELAQATQQAQQQARNQPGEPGKQALQRALERLAEQQRQLNQQASQLPAEGAQRGLQQARAAMDQAQRALARQDAAQAEARQRDAAAALDRLARQLPQQATPAQPARPDERAAAAAPGLPERRQVEQARQLAQEQRDLRDQVRRAAEQPAQAAATPRDNPVAQLPANSRRLPARPRPRPATWPANGGPRPSPPGRPRKRPEPHSRPPGRWRPVPCPRPGRRASRPPSSCVSSPSRRAGASRPPARTTPSPPTPPGKPRNWRGARTT